MILVINMQNDTINAIFKLFSPWKSSLRLPKKPKICSRSPQVQDMLLSPASDISSFEQWCSAWRERPPIVCTHLLQFSGPQALRRRSRRRDECWGPGLGFIPFICDHCQLIPLCFWAHEGAWSKFVHVLADVEGYNCAIFVCWLDGGHVPYQI